MQAAEAKIGRRALLTTAVRGACLAGAMTALLGLAGIRRADAVALRPPGALPEDGFLAACLRCAQCVQSCPYHVLKTAEAGDGPAIGTPFFAARQAPCAMCEDIPCVAACPSGALDKGLKDIAKARMGVAVLVGQDSCLNLQGLRCDVCYRACPRIDAAIRLEVRHNERTGKHVFFIPTVNPAECTGCGKCENACVLDEAAIKVLPRGLADGTIGRHYRLGWIEQQKAGRPLAGEPLRLPARTPGAAP